MREHDIRRLSAFVISSFLLSACGFGPISSGNSNAIPEVPVYETPADNLAEGAVDDSAPVATAPAADSAAPGKTPQPTDPSKTKLRVKLAVSERQGVTPFKVFFLGSKNIKSASVRWYINGWPIKVTSNGMWTVFEDPGLYRVTYAAFGKDGSIATAGVNIEALAPDDAPAPTDPTDPTVTTDPTDDTDATDPTEPTVTTDPTDNTDATDPTDGTDATDPTDGTDATDPTDDTDATDPTDATEPDDPTVTTEPDDPTVTTEPDDPTVTTEPDDPTVTTDATDPFDVPGSTDTADPSSFTNPRSANNFR